MKTIEKAFDVNQVWKSAYLQQQKINERGNCVSCFFSCVADRYAMDWAHCAGDWYQFDTTEDASYYGQWCNPVLRLAISFIEGDIYVIECPTADSYRAEIEAMEEFEARNNEQTLSEWYEAGRRGIDDHDRRHWAKARR
jgi:hypothetical protein